MNQTDLTALLPIIVLGASAVVVMLEIAFYRNHAVSATLSALGLAIAFVTIFAAQTVAPRQATVLVVVDRYALFYMGLLIAATFAVSVLSYDYLKKRTDTPDEYYVLLLLAAMGSSVLVASNHFASFFMGLELLSVSLYGLIAYPRDSERAIEAGVKYLTLAAASAAFLLFGMALVYADQGTMVFNQITLGSTSGGSLSMLLLTGMAMLFVGVGYKLALVPFHMWVPDVYEGAPAPVSSFVATVSKGGMFALLMRLFLEANIHDHHSLVVVLGLLAVLSMVSGNVLALMQNNVKRILAYSSIAHLGYLLVALLASDERAVIAATFYLAAYFLTTLAAFGVVGVLSGPEHDADSLDDYRGLFWRRPWLAALLAGALFSLAGIPLTVGFIGKFYVLAAGTGADLWFLAGTLVVSSAIGLYYYLHIIVVMYLEPNDDQERSAEHAPSAPFQPLAGSLVLAALALGLVWLGVYPSPLISLIRDAVARLV